MPIVSATWRESTAPDSGAPARRSRKLSDPGVSIEHMDATLLLIAAITLVAGAVIGWLAASSRGQSALLEAQSAGQAQVQAAQADTHAARAELAGLRATLEAERSAAAERAEAEAEAEQRLREAFHSLA